MKRLFRNRNGERKLAFLLAALKWQSQFRVLDRHGLSLCAAAATGGSFCTKLCITLDAGTIYSQDSAALLADPLLAGPQPSPDLQHITR